MKVGILGNGQLAQMLSIAAFPLNIKILAISENKEDPGNGVTPIFQGSYLNEKDLENFCQEVDVITFETENIPPQIAKFCEARKKLYPSSQNLEMTQNRLFEKNLFRALNIPVADYFEINTLDDLLLSLKQTNIPAFLKTRRMGYDGKGQYLIRDLSQAEEAFKELGAKDLILESFIRFDREVSILAVRNSREIRYYPLTQNTHQSGILAYSIINQNDFNSELQLQAQSYARLIMEKYNYYGLLTIEFFVKNNQLIANEMAPRVHNSGHWTIEGSYTSQFENHLRAILNLPLGHCNAKNYAAMFNLIGTVPLFPDLLAFENLAIHLYGKAPRENRKLGHVTLIEQNEVAFKEKFAKLQEWIKFNKNYK